MLGNNFPISEYYRDHIVDAVTISRGGNWWTALIVIADPENGQNFVGFYKWQRVGGEWKTRQKFLLKKRKNLKSVIESLGEFTRHFQQD